MIILLTLDDSIDLFMATEMAKQFEIEEPWCLNAEVSHNGCQNNSCTKEENPNSAALVKGAIAAIEHNTDEGSKVALDYLRALPFGEHNKSSFQFPKLEDVTTEVHGRLNKKHLPWCGSAVVAIQETYSILAGNKKR